MEIPATVLVGGLIQVIGIVALLIVIRWVIVLAKDAMAAGNNKIKFTIRPGSVTFAASSRLSYTKSEEPSVSSAKAKRPRKHIKGRGSSDQAHLEPSGTRA